MANAPLHRLRELFPRFLVLTGFALASAALCAADAPRPPAGPPGDPAAGPTVTMQAFEVTGSRLRSFAGEVDINNVISVDRTTIEEQGVQSIADLRALIPQLSVAANSAFTGNITSGTQVDGIANFQLRGLNGNATLVLIDGRRLPRTRQTGVSSDYDIYGIPISAIERIEVLPDGGSSVYGSDALGGVVNLILRKGYRGSELELSYENTFKTDSAVMRYNLTSGYSVGKLSLNLTANYETQNALAGVDRWWAGTSDRRFLGATTDGRSSVPVGGRIRVGTGTFPGTATSILRIPTGSDGKNVTAQNYINAGVPADEDRYDSAARQNLINESRRQAYTLRADYRVRDWLRPRVDFRWNRAINFGKGNPLGAIQNPTIPVGRLGNPFNVPIIVEKYFWEFGYGDRKYTTTDTSVVFGIDGKLPREWRYSAGLQFQKKAPEIEETVNQWNLTPLNAAITDPTQSIIVAHDSRKGAANAAGALEQFFFLDPSGEPNRIWSYDFKADGPVYTLPAGAIQTAFGWESRQDYVKFLRRNPNDTTQAAEPKGHRLTNSYFAEVKVPLLGAKKNFVLARSLSLSGSGRYDRYEDAATSTAKTFSGGASWKPFKWLAFRGTRNEGFKVPLLTDLNRNPSTAATQFGLTGTFVLFDTARNEQFLGNIPRLLAGNPNLKPERSESLNGGIAVDVPFVKGLTFDVSFWDTKIHDQVATLSNLQDMFVLFPEKFGRAALTAADLAAGKPGVINFLDFTPVNVSLRSMSGYDMRLSYTVGTQRFGRFVLNAAGTQQTRNRSFIRPGAAGVATVGLANRPLRLTGNLNWTRGPWAATVTHVWQEAYRVSITTGPDWPIYTNWNANVSYNFTKTALAQHAGWIGRAFDRARLNFAVMNVLEEGVAFSPTGGISPYIDSRLRRYTVTLRKGL